LRNRIINWIAHRRDDTDDSAIETSMTMNGIEYNTYQIWPIHVFAGIHLSGSGPDDDPRFIDPWWTQEWRFDKYAIPEGLLTWRWELLYLAAVPAYLIALAYLVVRVGMYLAQVGVIKATAATAKEWGLWAANGIKTYFTQGWPRASAWLAKLTSSGGSIVSRVLKIPGSITGLTAIYYKTGADDESVPNGVYAHYPSINKRVGNWRAAQTTCPAVAPFYAQREEEL
jgi:hypothetical protein